MTSPTGFTHRDKQNGRSAFPARANTGDPNGLLKPVT